MADRGMTPSEFRPEGEKSSGRAGRYTAANKMRNGTPMTVSYSGDISETITFDRAPDVNRRNHDRYSRFVTSLGSPQDD